MVDPLLPIGRVESPHCPRCQRAIELIGRRWTGAIVMVLLAGPARFCEIRTAVPGLSDRLLADRLRELEAEAIVSRCPSSEPGVQHYALTDTGADLGAVIDAVSAWAARWLD